MGCRTSRFQSRWDENSDEDRDSNSIMMEQPDGPARLRRYSSADTSLNSREGSFKIQERVDHKVVGVSE